MDVKYDKLLSKVREADTGGSSSLVISTSDPQALGTAAPGTTGQVSDAGHVHAMPSAADVGAIASSEKAAANGVASLGADGKVPSAQLPPISSSEAITFAIGIGTTIIQTSTRGYWRCPFAATISEVGIFEGSTLPVASTAVIDLRKGTTNVYADSTSICASAKPTLTANTASIDSTLTGWATTVAAGDYLHFNVDSNNYGKRLMLTFKLEKS